jgi:hypothetical protein
MKTKTTNIVIIDETYYGCSRERDPSYKYDRGEKYTEHSIRGFRIAKKSDCCDVFVNFMPKKNVPYYLLYAIYDTGDSFGRDCGKIEFFDLYANREPAEASCKILNGFTSNQNHNERSDYSVTIFDDKFKPYKTTVPWLGYFETLQNVYVETVYLEKKHGQ